MQLLHIPSLDMTTSLCAILCLVNHIQATASLVSWRQILGKRERLEFGFALQDIPEGEELCFDYHFNADEA